MASTRPAVVTINKLESRRPLKISWNETRTHDVAYEIAKHAIKKVIRDGLASSSSGGREEERIEQSDTSISNGKKDLSFDC